MAWIVGRGADGGLPGHTGCRRGSTACGPVPNSAALGASRRGVVAVAEPQTPRGGSDELVQKDPLIGARSLWKELEEPSPVDRHTHRAVLSEGASR